MMEVIDRAGLVRVVAVLPQEKGINGFEVGQGDEARRSLDLWRCPDKDSGRGLRVCFSAFLAASILAAETAPERESREARSKRPGGDVGHGDDVALVEEDLHLRVLSLTIEGALFFWWR